MKTVRSREGGFTAGDTFGAVGTVWVAKRMTAVIMITCTRPERRNPCRCVDRMTAGCSDPLELTIKPST